MIISGKLEKFAEHWQITHPDYVSLDINQFKEIACIEPVYQLCRGITNKRIGNIISSNLKELPDLPEWIDDTLIKQKMVKLEGKHHKIAQTKLIGGS